MVKHKESKKIVTGQNDTYIESTYFLAIDLITVAIQKC